EGMTFARTSPLVMTTTVLTMATVLALQFFDYEYSKIFARMYPKPPALAGFLGVFYGLTTLAALLLQWFVGPWRIVRLRLERTNVMFRYTLLAAFGGMLLAPTFVTAMAGRFTRMGLMPSLRATTLNLMLNAVPRKMGVRVRSVNAGVAVPVGQGFGAVLLVVLKGLGVPLLFPALGVLASVGIVWFAHRQNRAYGEALVGLLRENQMHLLDLDDDNLRHLDATAVAAISERLRSAQADMSHTAAVVPEGQDTPELATADNDSHLT